MTDSKMPDARIPDATYRLQFNHLFRFQDAAAIIPYLHNLGISDIYTSPYLKAREGSLHGYDIVSHAGFNPEIGTEEEYCEMTAGLQDRGMGQLLDIVPNHMCIASDGNTWWMDLLENGPSSAYAAYFDIDWDPVKAELRNKILLPVLGDQYGTVLENQELKLSFEDGVFSLRYYQHHFPIRPGTYACILEYRLEELKKVMGEGDASYEEYLSIMTAIGHLPVYTETGYKKVGERHREKEIIKRRLSDLCGKSPVIMGFIEENVRLFNGKKNEPTSFDRLDSLLGLQVYRLSHWQVATDEINYRRFFDINELAAIRMENPAVFLETHDLIFRLIREGKVTGLRVDHPDGLYDPADYFCRLQVNCSLHAAMGRTEAPVNEEEVRAERDRLLTAEPRSLPFYIVGEKILLKGERMPEDWPIMSTTGYVFLNTLNGLFVDTSNAKAFEKVYSQFIGEQLDFHDIVYEKKKLIMEVSMSSEVNMLGHYLNLISERDRHTRDFTLNSLTAAIIEVIAFFPVYRTYVTASGIIERDRRYIEYAVSKAKRKNPAISGSVFDFLREVLMLDHPGHLDEEDRKNRLDFAMRFQQITGPVTAKGVEDTAFYVYNRLVSLNEVGGSPERFGASLDTFHGQNIERGKFWPHALIASSTHDTKRSEDIRARINVLSEMPGEWKSRLVRWRRVNRKKKRIIDGRPVPDGNEEYLLYQSLVGVWPLEELNEADREGLLHRVQGYMLKALREAKVNTSWVSSNGEYENAVMEFVGAVLADPQFLDEFMPFKKRIAWYGQLNALSQVLLKITSPGVPDFYQGSDLWDFSLVDPDNRRAVDYGKRIGMLNELQSLEKERPLTELAAQLVSSMDDGKIKLYLTWKALQYRRENIPVFRGGEYIPLDAQREKKDHVCAFARKRDDKATIVVAPRLFTGLAEPGRPPLGEGVWGDTCLVVPFAAAGENYRNILTGEAVTVKDDGGTPVLLLKNLLRHIPVALLHGDNRR